MIVFLDICKSPLQIKVTRRWQIMGSIKPFTCTIWNIPSNSLFFTEWGHFLLVDALI